MDMNAKLYGIDGADKGTTALPDDLFAQPVHEHLMWLSVKRHLGNQRQGTAMVKSKGLVSGGGKKPFKQKGTGNARQGSNTSPLMPGGGRAFGPKPHSHRTEMPKRQRRAALVSALSLRARLLVDGLDRPDVLLLAALLHDIAHVPFGHTLEDEFCLLPRHDQDAARFQHFLGEHFLDLAEDRVVLQRLA